MLCQSRPHSCNFCGHSLFVTTAAAVGSDDESRDAMTANDGAATRRHSLGLLRGVDTTIDKFYAHEIDICEEGLAWLSQPGLMWEAAKKDAAEKGIPVEKYIEEVETNFGTFSNSHVVYDRQELVMYLNKAFSKKGSLTLLLGGKNVGKSKVLKSLAKIANNSSELLVLYVDARYSPGRLDIGLANGIAQLVFEHVYRTPEPNKDWIKFLTENNAAINFVLLFFPFAMKKELRDILRFIRKVVLNPTSKDMAAASETVIQRFIKIANDRKRYPVLVIDEVNVVLGNKGKPDSQTKGLLINFESYTKQDSRINVILASSQHAYPYRLEREGFNLENVKETIFAGEIPPKEMWKLLVSATYEEGDHKGKAIIGMGPHLAELCLAAYGGHIWTVENAIQRLSSEQGEAEATLFLPDLRSKIIRCLNTNPMSRPLLEAMAKYGIAPIEEKDNSAAKLISKVNVGGVITKTAVCIGIPRTEWKNPRLTDAVVPSSQCVRLRIAEVLLTRPLKNENE